MNFEDAEKGLRNRARELIAGGQLPARQPAKVYGGYGIDGLCSLCERRIARDELEYEVESRYEGEARTYRFHLTCHAAWQLECVPHERAESQTRLEALS
jgi:hypothetical protein